MPEEFQRNSRGAHLVINVWNINFSQLIILRASFQQSNSSWIKIAGFTNKSASSICSITPMRLFFHEIDFFYVSINIRLGGSSWVIKAKQPPTITKNHIPVSYTELELTAFHSSSTFTPAASQKMLLKTSIIEDFFCLLTSWSFCVWLNALNLLSWHWVNSTG